MYSLLSVSFPLMTARWILGEMRITSIITDSSNLSDLICKSRNTSIASEIVSALQVRQPLTPASSRMYPLSSTLGASPIAVFARNSRPSCKGWHFKCVKQCATYASASAVLRFRSEDLIVVTAVGRLEERAHALRRELVAQLREHLKCVSQYSSIFFQVITSSTDSLDTTAASVNNLPSHQGIYRFARHHTRVNHLGECLHRLADVVVVLDVVEEVEGGDSGVVTTRDRRVVSDREYQTQSEMTSH